MLYWANAKTKTKVNKRLISLKDRAAQASTRPYERMETQVREPNITCYISPNMLLIDVSIEGFKNMWKVALQMPGPQ